MFDLETSGRALLIAGVIILVVGGFLLLASRIPGLDQLGQLPGDIRIQSPDGRFSCFVPLATSLVLSIVLTVILNLVIRVLNR
ncbi:MAG: DUF2905 domain-containing protein [Chloroflexi bacterium]|nr:DUF2905 domain-containing protein [Chloroflexota bacterium]